jgi:hypothetical protein
MHEQSCTEALLSDGQIKLYRFADLKAANIVTSWPQLKRLVEARGFPPGYLLSPGVRVWDACAIESFLDTRRKLSTRTPIDA